MLSVVDPALTKRVGGRHTKSDDTFLGVSGGMSPGNILDFGSLKRHFQHFEVTFEQNIKVSNHIVNS